MANLYSVSSALDDDIKSRLSNQLPEVLHECCDGLTWCLATTAFRDALVFWLQRFDLLLYIKAPIPDQEAVRILKVLWKLIIHPEQDHKSLASLCRMFSDVLSIVPPDLNFEIQWKEFYDLADRYVFSPYGRNHPVLPRSLGASIMSLLPSICHWFEEGCTQEMIDTFVPFFCPYDTQHHKAHGFLCTLLPVRIRKHHEPPLSFLPAVLKSWEWSDQTLLEPHILTMRMLARIAFYRPDFDWSPHFGSIMAKILHLLHLPLSQQSGTGPKLESSYSKFLVATTKASMFFEAAGKWLAHSLRPVSLSPLYLEHFKHFIRVIKPFLHPQTEGHWSRSIGDLLSSFTSELNSRVTKAQLGDVRRLKVPSVDPKYHLPREFVVNLCEDLYPALLTAVYARSSSLSHDALLALSDLAELEPHVIIPPVLTTVQESLLALQEPHLVPPALMLMSFSIQPLLRYLGELEKEDDDEKAREVWGQFTSITSDCLVAIDPVDSKKCLNALKMYLSICTRIPLTSPDSITSPSWRKYVSSLRSLSLNIVERLCVLVRVGEVPSDATFEGLADALFQSMDDQLFASAFEVVFDFLKNNIVSEDPFSSCAALVAAVTFRNPSFVIPKLLKFIESRVFDRSVGLLMPSDISLASLPRNQRPFYESESSVNVFLGSSDSSHYYLSVLNGCLTRAGSQTLVDSLPRVLTIVSAFFKSNDPSILQEASSCIRFAYYSLLCQYPSECRPFSDNTHPKNPSDYVKARSFEEINVEFYKPTQNTINQLLAVSQDLIYWCCKALADYRNRISASLSQRKSLLMISLQILNSLVVGLAPITRLSPTNYQYEKPFVYPTRMRSKFSLLTPFEGGFDFSKMEEFNAELGWLKDEKLSIRDQLCSITTCFCDAIAEVSDDPSALSVCSSILDSLASKNYCSSKWWAYRLEHHYQLRGLFIDETVSTDNKYTSRPLMIERTFLQLHSLLTSEVGYTGDLEAPKGAVDYLLKLSIHPYLIVRETSQEPIGYMTKNVAGVAESSVSFLAKICQEREPEFHEIKGLIYLFASRRLIASITRHWTLLAKFLTTIINTFGKWTLTGDLPSTLTSSELTRLIPHLLDVTSSFSDVFTHFEPIFSTSMSTKDLIKELLFTLPAEMDTYFNYAINQKANQNYKDLTCYLSIIKPIFSIVALSFTNTQAFLATPLLELMVRLIRPGCFWYSLSFENESKTIYERPEAPSQSDDVSDHVYSYFVRTILSFLSHSSPRVRRSVLRSINACFHLLLDWYKDNREEIDDPNAGEVLNYDKSLEETGLLPGQTLDRFHFGQSIDLSGFYTSADEKLFQKQLFRDDNWEGFFPINKDKKVKLGQIERWTPVQNTLLEFLADEKRLEELLKSFIAEQSAVNSQYRTHFFTYLGRFTSGDAFSSFESILTNLSSDPTDKWAQLAVSEVVCGFLRGARHWSLTELDRIWNFSINLLQNVYPRLTAEAAFNWQQNLHYVTLDRDLKRFLPLVMLAKTLVTIEEGKQSVGNLSKCLRLMDETSTELCWRKGPMAKLLAPHFMNAALSDYKLLRETAADGLFPFITSSIDFRNKKDLSGNGKLNLEPFINDQSVCDILNHLINQAHETLQSFDFQHDKPPSKSVLATRSLCRILNYLESSWESWALLKIFEDQNLVEVIVGLIGFPDPLISKRLRRFFLHIPVPPFEVSPLKILDSLEKSFYGPHGERSPALRKEILTTVRVFSYSFSFNTKVLIQYSNFLTKCLLDPNAEVRFHCCQILSTIHRFVDENTVIAHLNDYRTLARTALVRKDKDTLVKRHAGCLGLAAIVLAYPYEVPDYLPEIIVELAKHAPDPDPIGSLVRKVIRDFWQTHYEQWEAVHMKQFSEIQLEALKSCIVSQAHYV
ncbi:hypothetical protein P9112_006631 [Eukaryota sp. TZLM1-RC]